MPQIGKEYKSISTKYLLHVSANFTITPLSGLCKHKPSHIWWNLTSLVAGTWDNPAQSLQHFCHSDTCTLKTNTRDTFCCFDFKFYTKPCDFNQIGVKILKNRLYLAYTFSIFQGNIAIFLKKRDDKIVWTTVHN